jgi:hypothetical protein
MSAVFAFYAQLPDRLIAVAAAIPAPAYGAAGVACAAALAVWAHARRTRKDRS